MLMSLKQWKTLNWHYHRGNFSWGCDTLETNAGNYMDDIPSTRRKKRYFKSHARFSKTTKALNLVTLLMRDFPWKSFKFSGVWCLRSNLLVTILHIFCTFSFPLQEHLSCSLSSPLTHTKVAPTGYASDFGHWPWPRVRHWRWTKVRFCCFSLDVSKFSSKFYLTILKFELSPFSLFVLLFLLSLVSLIQSVKHFFGLLFYYLFVF